MRIGVISDTHDRLPAIDRGLEVLRERGAEVVVHPGDLISPFAAKRLLSWKGPLYVIYGNNDGERAGLKAVLPQIQDGPLWFRAGSKRVLVHHFIDWVQRADAEQADIVITGHTHEVRSERRDGKLFLNPGECCGWITGRCTVVVVESELMSAEIIEVTP